MLVLEPRGVKRRCQESYAMAASGQKVDNSVFTLQKLLELYRQAELCDVQLQVAIHLFHAHKLILSMSSDVFKTMLTDGKWPDARKARIVLNEEPECVEVFGEFLEYMYTGSIHLSNTSVLPLLTLADKYNIHDLCKECKQYMASHCHASLPNLKVVSWLQYAILCNDSELECTLRHYIQLNFTHVMQSEDFLTMRLDILLEILNCRHLVVDSEYALFTGLKNWLLHNTVLQVPKQNIAKGPEELHMGKEVRQAAKKTMQQLMSYVRFPLMKPARLLVLQSDPFVLRHNAFFASRLQAALSVHMYPHCRDRQSLCDSVDDGSKAARGNRYFQTQCSRTSRSFSSHNSGSRTILRRNSDTSIVCGSNIKSDFLEVMPACDALCPASASGVLQCESLTAHPSKHSQGIMNQCGRLFGSPVASPVWSIGSSFSRGGCTSCIPRNYTCDDWSTCLTIEQFATFPRYGSRTYFFSTPASLVPSICSAGNGCVVDCEAQEETDDSAVLEWQAELYPKGVHFPRAKMIGIPDNYDIDESSKEVVRLAVNSKTLHEQPCRVDISVLAIATGLEDGSEYVEALAHKTCIYDKDHTMHNIDSIVSLGELNRVESKYLTKSVVAPSKGRTCFKVVVIIKPAQ